MTQINELKRGAQIVVGTPGRTLDLLKRKRLKLGNLKQLILDEADEMLTMGFKDELDAILEKMPEEKQTLLFSATMSKEIRRITSTYMNDPAEISAARVNTAAKNVQHIYYMVKASDRYELLKRVADMNPNIYGIIFCRTRRDTKEVANKLMQDGYNADALHGDLSQAQRDEVMDRFRRHQLQLLVATDVASRGLDVNDLTHVINLNLPDNPEVYTHRSGRTGRAGKTGVSIAIINTRETRKIREIEKFSGLDFKQEQAPTGQEVCTKQLYALIDKIEKVEVDEDQIQPFLPEIYRKLEWLDRETLIKHFVSAEFNRFLNYYKHAKDINIQKREKKSKQDRRKVNFTKLYINVGTKQGLSPTRLIGQINEALDSSSAEIGRIDLQKRFSFFEIDSNVVPQLMIAMTGMNFSGTPLHLEVSEDQTFADRRPRSGGDRRGGGGRNERGGGRGRGRDNDRRGRSGGSSRGPKRGARGKKKVD